MLRLSDTAVQEKDAAVPKITLIGAGSAVFTRNLCSDILLAPALQDSTISLMDIDSGRLRTSRTRPEHSRQL
jgi:alpha-galactosidase/6-phospho-beta-glucosidase family protein